jgi:protein-tyrosine phosphatase
MAAARCQELAAPQLAAGQLTIRSAGVAAGDGAPASAMAAAALGTDALANFRSTALTADRVAEADRIITMTTAHREHVIRRFPEAAERTRNLLSLLGDDGDISDPFGGDLREYRSCLAHMTPALEALVAELESATTE